MPSAQSKLATLLATKADYPLHQLGWKAFQDLAIAVAEECLQRPVQSFLPTNDAGRDGAFIGRWRGKGGKDERSTIQCKFTSQQNHNLSLSLLSDEFSKAKSLAARGLASDYVILTNHPVTGASEDKIRTAFEKVGVRTCRIFGYDWIVRQIRQSPRLRMMAPRLYGLGDLTDVIDSRAYAQARLILSEMGDNLKKLVVTDAHRQSVRAISEHKIVLLLGSPAAGKSTIGASLAIGAADIWQSHTIKATSPDDVRRHVNPAEQQFFWIDDAWGSTQYQRDRVEAWNQVLPLIQGAIRQGTRFLLTSRDYIWNSARQELKLQALPILRASQVVIDVQDFTVQEKAQILYNHLRLGDQDKIFRETVRPFLPQIAVRSDFLPESARRLGNEFFTGSLFPTFEGLSDFFERPEEFLQETIEALSNESRAAIALLFLNGGKVRSPASSDLIEPVAQRWGSSVSAIREQLEALNGSILLLAQDDQGPFWTYKHPTIGDAFAKHVAAHPELVEVYLRGAKAETIVHEVVCAGLVLRGAQVVVPVTLNDLLLERIGALPSYVIGSFLSYRSSRRFSQMMLKHRPDLWNRFEPGTFNWPLADDMDAMLLSSLHNQGLLPERVRRSFVGEVRKFALDFADASFITDQAIKSVLKIGEYKSILSAATRSALLQLSEHINRVRQDWSSDNDPNDYFDQLRDALYAIANALSNKKNAQAIRRKVDSKIESEIDEMMTQYEAPSYTASPVEPTQVKSSPLDELFRDVSE